MNKNIRIFFMKTGRIKFISHLDLQRTMQRALKRSGLPVWETEGFNPHIYLTFALPLSLGIESVCESFDVKMTEEIKFDEICKKLNAVLTEDLQIIKAAEPLYKSTDIKKAEYEIILEQTEEFIKFLQQEKIIITKKSKKGEVQVDLKPLIGLKSCGNGKITIFLPAGTVLSINPNQVINAFKTFLGVESLKTKIKRTAVFCENGEHFN